MFTLLRVLFSTTLLLPLVSPCAIDGHRMGHFDEVVRYGSQLHCQNVVVTVNFGSPDHALPAVSTDEGVECNVAVVDLFFLPEVEQSRFQLLNWTVVRTVPVYNFGPRDSRIVKILTHLFFPRAEYVMYMDSNGGCFQSVSEIVRNHFQEDTLLLFMEGPNGRDHFDQELSAVRRKSYGNERLLAYQEWQYKRDNRSSLLSPLLHGAYRIQKRHNLVSAFACLWHDHVAHHSRRDQLSLVRVFQEMELESRTVVLNYKKDPIFLRPKFHKSKSYMLSKRSLTTNSCEIRSNLHCRLGSNVFLDMGANKGQSLEYLSSILGPNASEWTTVSAEANPSIWNVTQNVMNSKVSFRSSVLLKKAVWNQTSHITLYEDHHDHYQIGSPLRSSKTNLDTSHPVVVPSFSLSSFLRNHYHDFDFIFLKLDIAGAEYDVLEQMFDEGTIMLVDFMAIEFNDHRFPDGRSRGQPLREKLSQLGIPMMSTWDAINKKGWEQDKYDTAVFRSNLHQRLQENKF